MLDVCNRVVVCLIPFVVGSLVGSAINGATTVMLTVALISSFGFVCRFLWTCMGCIKNNAE